MLHGHTPDFDFDGDAAFGDAYHARSERWAACEGVEFVAGCGQRFFDEGRAAFLELPVQWQAIEMCAADDDVDMGRGGFGGVRAAFECECGGTKRQCAVLLQFGGQ